MRTLAITQNITLDGRVEMLGDWFDPQAQGDMDDLMAENRRQDAAADRLLLGRRTFEDLRGYWRDLSDDATGIAEYLGGVEKYVVSATLTEPEWDGTTVIGLDDVAGLKRDDGEGGEPGKDVVCTGSIRLCHALVEANLVDEYRLFTYPAVQGRGRTLWPDDHDVASLRRLDVQPFRSGITLHTYAAA